LNQLINLIKN